MAAVSAATVSYDNAVFRVLYSCFALLTLKILLMVPLARFPIYKEGKKKEVDRVKRAHLNDLENIPVFIFTAFWYAALKPNPLVAIPLIIVYTLARFAHTFVYAIVVVKQPARFICYATGYLVTGYMASYIILTFIEYK